MLEHQIKQHSVGKTAYLAIIVKRDCKDVFFFSFLMFISKAAQYRLQGSIELLKLWIAQWMKYTGKYIEIFERLTYVPKELRCKLLSIVWKLFSRIAKLLALSINAWKKTTKREHFNDFTRSSLEVTSSVTLKYLKLHLLLCYDF